MMKKVLLAVTLAATLSFSLVGCGSKNSDTKSEETTAAASEIDGYWVNNLYGMGYHFENGTAEQKEETEVTTYSFTVEDGNIIGEDGNKTPYVLDGDLLTITLGFGDMAFTKGTADEFNNLEKCYTGETSEIDGYWINEEHGMGYYFEKGALEQKEDGKVVTGTFAIKDDAILMDEGSCPYVLDGDTLTITLGFGDLTFTKATADDYNNL